MTVRIICADVIDGLRQLADESVHCVVTSPPYWGLRDYGTASWEGGNAACDHLKPAAHGYAPHDTSTLGPKRDGLSPDNSAHAVETKRQQFRDVCGKCGARRVDHQIGLEATPEAYVTRMVAVFREVRRVLRTDGVCWLNLGDCYATGAGKVGDHPGGGEQGRRWAGHRGSHTKNNSGKAAYRMPNADGIGPMTQPNRLPIAGLKPKDLVGIPWMVAFALRAEGWWLRSDICWSKPNPMPESVTDRPTKSHEYVFLLTKAERYFYDAEAIKEEVQRTHSGGMYRGPNNHAASAEARGTGNGHTGLVSNKDVERGFRNKRSVWTVATSPYPEAHFATFPSDLIAPMILAGTSEKGCCAKCGAPWEREMAATGVKNPRDRSNKCDWIEGVTQGGNASGIRTLSGATYQPQRGPTGAWAPTCECGVAETLPATVLDPFSGAGTTCLVADRLQRSGIGIELNPKYADMARRRIEGDAPLFAEVTAA